MDQESKNQKPIENKRNWDRGADLASSFVWTTMLQKSWEWRAKVPKTDGEVKLMAKVNRRGRRQELGFRLPMISFSLSLKIKTCGELDEKFARLVKQNIAVGIAVVEELQWRLWTGPLCEVLGMNEDGAKYFCVVFGFFLKTNKLTLEGFPRGCFLGGGGREGGRVQVP